MNLDYDFDRAERSEKRKKFWLSFILWIFLLSLAVGLAWILTEYALEFTNMTDASMEITLQQDDTILINKLIYTFKEPERYDVIVFKKDGKEHSYYSIKRVIGLPGETVYISGGCVYINGELLREPMQVDAMELAGLAEETIVLDEDEYFVLGDSRNDSQDSRFANVGNVSRSEIIGKAWLRTNKFAFIGRLNYNAQDDETEE